MDMNAVRNVVARLPRESIRRILVELGQRPSTSVTSVLRSKLADLLELDLARLLNQLRKAELVEEAKRRKLDDTGSAGQLRARLWLEGARMEAGGEQHLSRPWQPVPQLFRGKLVHFGPIRGQIPPADTLPREVPPSRDPPSPYEPDTLEELLANANALVGVRLGARGRDKGAYGSAVARLLGLAEGCHAEPDWRGEVEVKTLPVARERRGLWFVKEDPAISMETVRPLSKLERVLWVVRVADEPDAPILSWYYQEMCRQTRALAMRTLHKRPKGPANTDKRGWYLRKTFFIGSGLLKSLNG